MSILIKVLLFVQVIVSLLLILVVLMQRPKNEGLGAAFGGGMTDSLFGAQTTNVLSNITRWLGTAFFVLTFGISVLYARQGKQTTDIQKKMEEIGKQQSEEKKKEAEAKKAADEAKAKEEEAKKKQEEDKRKKEEEENALP